MHISNFSYRACIIDAIPIPYFQRAVWTGGKFVCCRFDVVGDS
jgi:hypothetical protein